MNLLALLALIPALLAPVADQRPVGTITIEQTTVLRIPVHPHPHPRLGGLVEWHEGKGPKCLPLGAVGGAMLAGPNIVDFLTRDRQRFRARIDGDCTALDFYDGFYIQPQDDRLCARRDEIRSRMGASCRIQGFTSLVPTFRR